MDKDFNLDSIGKRMPYTAPEGFLDDLEDQVWAQVKDDMQQPAVQMAKPKRHYGLWYSISAVAVAACVALLIFFKTPSVPQETYDMQSVEEAFAELSDADQEYLLAVYQDDLFINQ